MAGFMLPLHKFAFLSIALILICVFIFSSKSLYGGPGLVDVIKDTVKETAKEAAHETASSICHNEHKPFGNPTIADSIQALFQTVQHPISSSSYQDTTGRVFKVGADPSWKEPLRNDVLIVDIDTRMPSGKNELWNDGRMNWEDLDGTQTGGIVSASFMNHYLYAKTHGYDYRFFNAHDIEGLHSTWVRPHVLEKLLQSYRFVVTIDADATIQHLELPIEWLFNRWGITPHTSIAMPIDTRQVWPGNEHSSEDSKGKVVLNAGFIIAQSLPHTFKLLKAWKDCPDEQRYPGCGQWKQQWSHEQKAFSEYIRYDYNPDGNNIVEIPCDDAMGYPGLYEEHEDIKSNCTGQFLRHHTLNKERTKASVEGSVLQLVADVAHRDLIRQKKMYWIKEQ